MNLNFTLFILTFSCGFWSICVIGLFVTYFLTSKLGLLNMLIYFLIDFSYFHSLFQSIHVVPPDHTWMPIVLFYYLKLPISRCMLVKIILHSLLGSILAFNHNW